MTELVWLFVGLALGGGIAAIICLWRHIVRCEQEVRRLKKKSGEYE